MIKFGAMRERNDFGCTRVWWYRLWLICLVQWLMLLGGGRASAVELWQTWVARHNVTQVAEADLSLFVLADGALHSLSKADDAERLYDRTSGLSDVGIAHIAWSGDVDKLLIVYHSGMIDLLGADGVEHIPALRDATHIQQKEVAHICIEGDKAWLAGTYGIIQIDLDRALIEGTYWMNTPVQSVAKTEGGELIAVLSGQIYQGRLTDNLQDPTNWRERSDLGSEWQRVVALGATIVGHRGSEAVVLGADGVPTAVRDIGAVNQLYLLSDVVVLQGSDGLYALEGDTAVKIATAQALGMSGSIKGYIWLAQGTEGLMLLHRDSATWGMRAISIQQATPRSNSMYAMRYQGGRLYTVGGGRDKDRFRSQGVVQIFDGKGWECYTDKEVKPQTGIDFIDPIDIIPHRDGKPLHFYVATWGEGLYEFDAGRVVARYDVDNSALASALPGRPHYTRVGSLCYDKVGNLWMAQGLTEASNSGSVVRLSPTGQWRSYDYQPIRASNSFHTQIALPSGTKWLLDNHLADHGEGVFVYNDRGTEDISDDVYAHYASLRESNGKAINFSKVSAMAVDKKGALCLGANIGFFYVPRPDEPPRADRPPVAVRPIAEAEDGSLYYVLDNVSVSAIAVDALNRKWLGTSSRGLYLLSEDGLEVLRHYTVEGSPLLSNQILSLAIDEVGGRLFIGTAMGLNVLDIRTVEDVSKDEGGGIIAYPNPLRPEHPNQITLEGLTAGATIEVSNAAGWLVHRGQTVDNRYEWHTYGGDGRRLPSGVYTIVVHSRSQKKMAQIKVTIISND